MKREGKMADLQVAFDMVDGETGDIHSLQDSLWCSPSKMQKNTVKHHKINTNFSVSWTTDDDCQPTIDIDSVSS